MRYELLAEVGVRDIAGYNAAFDRGDLATTDDPDPMTGKGYERLPYILVVVDELNDLMMVAARDVEASICRIAQMARAVGIHLVIATQRPSVDVITGVIKANIPSRLAFSVTSLADSRVILDQAGRREADRSGRHAARQRVVEPAPAHPGRVGRRGVRPQGRRALAAAASRSPSYVDGIAGDDAAGGRAGAEVDDDDELLAEAMELVVRSGLGSTSMLQRKLRVGFSRAGRLMDLMERKGVVGPSEGSKARAVLMTVEEFEELEQRGLTSRARVRGSRTMEARGRRPRSALATVWILVACAAIGTGIGLVVRHVRSDDGSGPKPIRVRPARPGPHSAAGLWLFGATTVRLDPTTLSDPRDVGFQGFGAVLGGEGTVNLYDPTTGRLGVIDATRNELAGRTNVPVQSGVSAEVAPVLADAARRALAGDRARPADPRRARDRDDDRGHAAHRRRVGGRGGRSTRGDRDAVVADDEAAWAVYELGVTGNPALPAAVRVADDGTVTARAAVPDRVDGNRFEPQAVALGDGMLWIVGRTAVVGLDPATLAVRGSFTVQDGTPVDLHGAAVAGGLLWSYDAQSGALLGIGPDVGRVRQRVVLAGGAQTRFRAPATVLGGGDVLWVRARVGSPNMLEQLITRVDAQTGDVTGRFTAPPQLEVGEIAVSRVAAGGE